MLMNMGKRTYDADVREGGRAFRVRATIQPAGVNLAETIKPITYNHSIVKKSKRGKGGG